MCVCIGEKGLVCVSVMRERGPVCMCVCVTEGTSVYVCVREGQCVCVCERGSVFVFMCLFACGPVVPVVRPVFQTIDTEQGPPGPGQGLTPGGSYDPTTLVALTSHAPDSDLPKILHAHTHYKHTTSPRHKPHWIVYIICRFW